MPHSSLCPTAGQCPTPPRPQAFDDLRQSPRRKSACRSTYVNKIDISNFPNFARLTFLPPLRSWRRGRQTVRPTPLSRPEASGGTSRGSETRSLPPAVSFTAAARPGRSRRRSDPQLVLHRGPADPRPLLRPAPTPAHPPRPPPARGPPLPHRHAHRAVTPAQEPPRLPRAPLRHRRVGGAARPGAPGPGT